LPDDHPFKKVRAQPEGKTAPELWLLGSSDYSGLLAAQLGVRFSFAHFINAHGGDAVTRAYQQRYQKTGREPEPHAAVCCFVICAETDAEAERRARVVDSRRLDMAYNLDTVVPTQEQAEKRTYTAQEQAHTDSQRPRLVHGSAATCKARLEAIAAQYAVEEVMVLTITGSYATRLESYERLAEAFGL
jgi:luciferase family oxidoreductase group 1